MSREVDHGPVVTPSSMGIVPPRILVDWVNDSGDGHPINRCGRVSKIQLLDVPTSLDKWFVP